MKMRDMMGLQVDKDSNPLRQERIKLRLRVVHDRIAPPPGEPPPCSTCVAPCCTNFIVTLSKQEYDSGLYGDKAIKMDKATLQQLASQRSIVLLGMFAKEATDDVYLLEGDFGVRCSFLGDDNRCTIYNDRPIVCRSYTCTGDDRITPEMRAGE